MFRVGLFTTRIWKQTRYPSAGEWLNGGTSKQQCYWALKQMYQTIKRHGQNFKYIQLSKINQSERLYTM